MKAGLAGMCRDLDEELIFLTARLRSLKDEVGDGIGRLSSLAVVLGECGNRLKTIRSNNDRLKAELIFADDAIQKEEGKHDRN